MASRFDYPHGLLDDLASWPARVCAPGQPEKEEEQYGYAVTEGRHPRIL